MSLRTDTVLASLPSASHWVRHEVVLVPSFAAVCQKIKASVHRNLHKARRLGLRFERRTDENSMDGYYHLHVLTRRKLGVPAPDTVIAVRKALLADQVLPDSHRIAASLYA
jgi:hypothetical protein